jgi:hypothetical protein
MTETREKVDTMIWDDHRITRSELTAATGIGKLAVMANIREPGYRKVCTRWVLKMHTIRHRTAQKTYVQNFASVMRKLEMLFG